MRPITVAMCLTAASLSFPAAAQDKSPPKPAPAPVAATNGTASMNATSEWRASKLIGLDVYNGQNEKVGDISEVLLDHSGKVVAFVIGVGGFLGMGAHDVLIPFDQIKFVDEPVKASSASAPRPGTTGGPAGSPNRPAATNTAPSSTQATTDKWYPDHAVIDATKDQLKAMKAFKYS